MERIFRSASASGSSLHSLNQRVCRESYGARSHQRDARDDNTSTVPRTANPATFELVPAAGQWRMKDPSTRWTFL